MKALVQSVTDRLISAGLTAYWLEVPDKPAYPYVLLWSSGGNLATVTVCAERDHLSDRLGVTCVSQSALGVLDVVRRTRAALTGWSPASGSWHVQPLVVVDSQQAQVDRDVVLPNTNRHPSYAVDLYRLLGEPKET